METKRKERPPVNSKLKKLSASYPVLFRNQRPQELGRISEVLKMS